MSSNNKNLHLTVQERIIIEKGIENGSTKAAIALTIGKDKSTVGKEIKKHRELVHKSSYKINCANMKNCSHNHVCVNCADFKPFTCNRRDRSPVHVTAVLNIRIVAMISIDTRLIFLIKNIEKTLLILELVSICHMKNAKLWLILSFRLLKPGILPIISLPIILN